MNLSSLSLNNFSNIFENWDNKHILWVYSLKIDYGHLLCIEVLLLQLSCYLEIHHIHTILSTHELKRFCNIVNYLFYYDHINIVMITRSLAFTSVTVSMISSSRTGLKNKLHSFVLGI